MDSMDSPPPTPWVVTDAQVEDYHWHDASLHALRFDVGGAELLLDLDWPIRTIAPKEGGVYLRSWLSPATLVFHGVSQVEGSLTWPHDATILAIGPDDPNPPETPSTPGRTSPRWWLVKGAVGYLRIAATGFTQFARQAPVLVEGQTLTPEQRGGISFAREQVAPVVA